MTVVVFLSLREQLCIARAVGVEREVFVEDGLHVGCRLGGRSVAKGACLKLGQDCAMSDSEYYVGTSYPRVTS